MWADIWNPNSFNNNEIKPTRTPMLYRLFHKEREILKEFLGEYSDMYEAVKKAQRIMDTQKIAVHIIPIEVKAD